MADCITDPASSPQGSRHASLDNPALAALTGPHAHLAQQYGNAVRYHPDVCPMAALPDDPSSQDWSDAARLVGPGGSLFLPVVADRAPTGWTTTMHRCGVQMIDDGVATAPDSEAVELTAADVPEMTELVRRTRPGPFRPRTIEMGTYLGVRRDGRLIAMGGERLSVPGHVEISAVCTDPDHRGLGLASRLVLALAHGIRARGLTPILHADAENVNAIRLYEHLGFVIRTHVEFQIFEAPK